MRGIEHNPPNVLPARDTPPHPNSRREVAEAFRDRGRCSWFSSFVDGGRLQLAGFLTQHLGNAVLWVLHRRWRRKYRTPWPRPWQPVPKWRSARVPAMCAFPCGAHAFNDLFAQAKLIRQPLIQLTNQLIVLREFAPGRAEWPSRRCLLPQADGPPSPKAARGIFNHRFEPVRSRFRGSWRKRIALASWKTTRPLTSSASAASSPTRRHHLSIRGL